MTEEALFHAALAVPAADRAAYLDAHCPDPVLRRRVEDLLAAHDRPAGPLDSPATGEFQPEPEPDIRRIGPYKLLQRIGEGGMGSVWMAEQEHPVRRRVAVKVIKPGMDSQQVLARFEAERQALAMMDHPNIAKVLDAGATDAGSPYFVMELVKGVPITRFCDENHLTTKERLELFVPVCQAIQHAHQKGVIHRDLKPSNVLVALYDDRPVPKVIDFGVAKAAGERLTDKTMFTEFGAVVGTLEYMSPEQAKLNQLDIDTRSDVYSLGVLLYELLTGTTPLDRKRLRSAAFDEMLRIIREEEPQRPSTRLSGSAELPSIAAVRKTEPAKLSKLVRGELDWIVMKALEKDRSRRYETANGLARDVQRYLADEPVEACPPSAAYRVRKFARKHRTAMSAAAAFGVILAIFTALSIFFAIVSMNAEFKAKDGQYRAERAEQLATERLVEAERQRDLAQTAERERRAELGKTAAAAAGLAAQRGRWREALALYDTALATEGGDEVALKLGRINCRYALVNYREVLADLDELAARPDPGKYAGQVLLEQAYAATWRPGGGDPQPLAQAALARGLPPADAAYAQVMLDTTAPAAIAHLRDALRHDPFHWRCQELLTMLLFLTGDKPEFQEAAARMQLLRPDSAHAVMMELFARAMDGDRSEVDRLAGRLADYGMGEFTPLFRLLGQVMIDARADDFFWKPVSAERKAEFLRELVPLLGRLNRLVGGAGAGDRPLGDYQFLDLPLFRALAGLPAVRELADKGVLGALGVAVGDPGKVADVYAALTAVLPNGVTFLHQGEYLAHAGRLREAEAALRQSVNRPAWGGNHRPKAWCELVVVEWNLSVRADTPAAERVAWRDKAAADLRDLARSGPLSPEALPLMITIAGYLGEHGVALVLAEDWRRQRPDDTDPWLRQIGTEYALGATDRARATSRTFLAGQRQRLGDTPQYAEVLLKAAAEPMGRRQFADAEPLLLEGYERLKGHPAARARAADAAGRLVLLYNAWGKPDEAAKWRKELATLKEVKP